MSSSASSNSIQIVTNLVFGITATAISIVTVWQGHRVWKMWREYAHGRRNVAPDIELGLHPAISLGPPGHEEVVASSAPLTNQAGDVIDSTHTPMPHPTLPTTAAAETSPHSGLVQGAQIDSNELREVHAENAPPAVTGQERQGLRPAAHDHP